MWREKLLTLISQYSNKIHPKFYSHQDLYVLCEKKKIKYLRFVECVGVWGGDILPPPQEEGLHVPLLSLIRRSHRERLLSSRQSAPPV